MDYLKIKTPMISMLIGLAIGGIMFFSTSATTVEKSNSESVDDLYQELELKSQQINDLEVLDASSVLLAEPMLGQIAVFAGNYPPRGWQFCNGQEIAISTNTALFSVLGTTYGGDGRTNFKLPDMRGRIAIHSDGSDKYPLGKKGRMKSKIVSHDASKHDEEIFTKGTEGYQTLNYIIAVEGVFPSRG